MLTVRSQLCAVSQHQRSHGVTVARVNKLVRPITSALVRPFPLFLPASAPLLCDKNTKNSLPFYCTTAPIIAPEHKRTRLLQTCYSTVCDRDEGQGYFGPVTALPVTKSDEQVYSGPVTAPLIGTVYPPEFIDRSWNKPRRCVSSQPWFHFITMNTPGPSLPSHGCPQLKYCDNITEAILLPSLRLKPRCWATLFSELPPSSLPLHPKPYEPTATHFDKGTRGWITKKRRRYRKDKRGGFLREAAQLTGWQ
uniref:Uncharacterized protein n=1 Tax=Timema poppense TaxID=170557 RepID=A0A7R9D925_TIMPO|nr:unnamed protein product [Timema poppensis]